MNKKLIGVLLALISLLVMPIFTILTIVPFFLELYGFPPLIPSLLKNIDWHLILLITISIPVYFVMLTIIWIGYKKILNPDLEVLREFKKIYFTIPQFIIDLFKEFKDK